MNLITRYYFMNTQHYAPYPIGHLPAVVVYQYIELPLGLILEALIGSTYDET